MKDAFEESGDVRDVDLLAAFVALWRHKASGTLQFSRSIASAGFHLANGEIFDVSSSEPRFETAAILVRAGKLDTTALERLTVPPGSDAALAALAAGLLTRREWKWGQKIRAIEILTELLSWNDGEYVFDPAARPASGDFVLTIPRLLLELFLRSRDQHLVDHQLGPTDVPLARCETFEEDFATFGLTADAESVVRLIDGKATAAEISERAPAEEFAVLKLLAALKTLDLIRPQPATTEEPAAKRLEPSLPAVLPEPSPSFESWGKPEPPAVGPEEVSEAEQAPGLAEMPLAQAEDQEDLGESQMPAASEEDSFSPELELARPAEDAEEPEPEPEPEPFRVERDSSSTDWDSEPVPSSQRVLDGSLDQPTDSLPEFPTVPPGRPRGLGLPLAGILVALAVAVGFVLLRSGSVTKESAAPTAAPAAVTEVPTLAPPSPAASQPPTPVPPTAVPPTPAPATPARAPTAVPTRQSRPVLAPPSRVNEKRGASPGAATASVPAASDSNRDPWEQRARRFLRQLRSEKKTRYAIQLELACEPSTLSEAWKHDQPAGSMWLLTTPHAGHECFRVLWGRFGTLQEAKKAKAGIPSYFVTDRNSPAVVSVR